jgi:UDP-N-acetylglucosamine 1-carboxyvinyltransferase
MPTKKSFIIEGLAEKKTLKGSVKINGAKNAALKALAATVLFDGPVTLKNIPDTDDMKTLSEVLRKLGAKIDKKGTHELVVDTSSIKNTDIDAELAKSMRASVVLTGPMLGRFSKTTFPSPGGCVIGARPIDLFIDGYKKMGATVTENDVIYKIEGNVKGAEIIFEKISVGATETLMMAAVLAKGKTILKNCAKEPEIVNVADWLNECGARISGAGTSTIDIEGNAGKLLNAKKDYIAIPDRIEAGSFLILGALCAEELIIENCRPDHLEVLISMLKNAGVPISTTNDSIRISGNSKPNSSFKAFNVQTQEYPGFATDLQPQIVTFLTQSSGESNVVETIFEGRFKYVEDLIRLGATITTMNPREILVKGPTLFKELPDAEELSAHDIRAGFAVVIAALIGEGKFTINNVHLIDRGYEELEERLAKLGANIKRV